MSGRKTGAPAATDAPPVAAAGTAIGSSVIRMLQAYLGADEFRHGLQCYIDRFKYRNARTDDLWSVLGETSGKPVAQVMQSYTRQTGYPLVSVHLPSAQPAADRACTLALEQRRYLVRTSPEEPTDETLWWIPLTAIASASGPQVHTLALGFAGRRGGSTRARCRALTLRCMRGGGGAASGVAMQRCPSTAAPGRG